MKNSINTQIGSIHIQQNGINIDPFAQFKTSNSWTMKNSTNSSVIQRVQESTRSKTEINKHRILPAVLSTGIPACFGALHGIYKKIKNISTEVKFNESAKPKNKLKLAKINPEQIPYEKIKVAQAIILPQPIENKDIKIVITTNEHLKQIKITLNSNDNIDKLVKTKSEKLLLMLKDFKNKGFDSNKENLLEFLSRTNIDEFNKNNKFNIQIKLTDRNDKNVVQIIDRKYNKILHKGWKVLPYTIVDVPVIEHGWLELPSKTETLVEYSPKNKAPSTKIMTTEYATFKKILNPYDEKIFNFVDKLPFGKKLTYYMRKTNSPIKEIKFKPFDKLFYDKTSLLKGAGFMALVGFSTYILINKIYKSKNNN